MINGKAKEGEREMSKLLMWAGGFFIGAALYDGPWDLVASGNGIAAILGGFITMAGLTLSRITPRPEKDMKGQKGNDDGKRL